ncbi:MAG: cbb3-type cytochrome oxidase assembly protein CcoS [Sulfuricellaceae bacterium]|nr:cbb3-type cytochrome oxidase assembly protein CcoS [Sulfuricellaceae bacterium]
MEILYLLIPISVLLVFFIVVVFLWAVKGGQFDDLEGPAHRILMDDDRAKPSLPDPDSAPSPDKKV